MLLGPWFDEYRRTEQGKGNASGIEINSSSSRPIVRGATRTGIVNLSELPSLKIYSLILSSILFPFFLATHNTVHTFASHAMSRNRRSGGAVRGPASALTSFLAVSRREPTWNLSIAADSIRDWVWSPLRL